MKQVLFLPKYSPEGASSRYRTYQFLEYFEEEGYNSTVKPFFSNKHLKRINDSRRGMYFGIFVSVFQRLSLLFTVRKYDFVFIEKEAVPFFPPLFEVIIKWIKVKYILDYDDAVFHNYDSSRNKFIRLFLSRKIPYIMKSAAYIICGSQYLENYAKQFNPRVCRIPTVVSRNKYTRLEKKKDQFVIGWIGSYYTSNTLLLISDVLKKFASRHPCTIKFIGVSKEVFSHFDDMNFERIPWSAEAEEKVLPEFDVGIAPLNDTPFNRGKCAFKIIQYMAVGSAVICTPIQANGEVVADGVSGFHASDNETWEEKLEWLYSNRDELNSMKQNSWKRFVDNYSLEGVIPSYLQVFKDIIKDS